MNAEALVKELANYGKLLKRTSDDDRVVATHVSLLTALFIQWQRNNFVSPFPITRAQLMTHSKIASVATYHKCIRQLGDYGYICYEPSYHPVQGSRVHWRSR